MSKTFCRSIKMILVGKPSSKPFRILSVKKDRHRLVQWLVLNRDCNILLADRNSFVCLRTSFWMIFEIIGSNEKLFDWLVIFWTPISHQWFLFSPVRWWAFYSVNNAHMFHQKSDQFGPSNSPLILTQYSILRCPFGDYSHNFDFIVSRRFQDSM